MHYVYILRNELDRHYIGETADMETRLRQHRVGGTQTTRRMTGELSLVACRQFADPHQARVAERMLKRWKNPGKAIEFLRSTE